MPVEKINSLEAVRRFADHILDPSRAEPVVCVTTRHHESQPLLDVDEVARLCNPLTIHVLRTGEFTWELTAVLPERFEVFGGAARIWWPGLQPLDDPRRHPLIFCWSAGEAAAAADRLVRELRRRGYAKGDRVTAPAPTVARLVQPPARPPWVRRHPIDDIEIGDVLDGRVIEALPGGTEVEIAEGVRGWLVWRKRMGEIHVGDVVAVQVVGIDRQQRRVEIDPLPGRTAPAPVAQPTTAAGIDTHPPAELEGLDVDAAMDSARAAVAELRDEAEEVRRELAGELAAARARVLAFAQAELQDVVGTLERDLGEAQSEAASLRHQLHEAERDKRAAIQEMRKQRDRATEATKSWRSERDRRTAVEARMHGLGVHDDVEAQFRHEVEVASRRLSSGDASQRPTSYLLGEEFLESVERIQGVDRSRIVEAVARLVSGRRDLVATLDVHPLRESAAGGAPPRVRADGARAFRASLQHGAAAARRLHYWLLTDGTLELANVGYHEDMSIT